MIKIGCMQKQYRSYFQTDIMEPQIDVTSS